MGAMTPQEGKEKGIRESSSGENEIILLIILSP
jgi:hypothetical protein